MEEGGGDLSDHDFAGCSELESELRRLWNGGYSLAGVDGGVRGRLLSRTRSNLRETYASEFIRRTDSWWTTANPSRLARRRGSPPPLLTN